MPSITFDRFDAGLDLRKGASVADANRLRVLTNAYVTTGRSIQKRPVLARVDTLEPGTVGLKAAGGKLNTFYGQGTVTHMNPLFLANKVAHPTTAQDLRRAHYGEGFNGYLYCAVEYLDGSVWHHYLDGSSPTHVSDTNCPQSKQVLKQQSKLYGPKADVVRYCKTNAPRDWTTANDAGFLPTGLQAQGSTTATALGQFGKKKLVVFFPDGTQIWDVDPDPAQMALDSLVANIGTRYPKTPIGFSGDVFFLADAGFRSITVSQVTDNLQDVDIGSPIDGPVLASLDAVSDPISLFYSGLGQFWCMDGTTVWVYAFSRTAKIAAWSRFELPVAADDATVLNGELYVRNGNNVYKVVGDQYADNGSPPQVSIELPFLDFKAPGVMKQLVGVDAVVQGSANVQFRYDPRNPELITDPIPLSGDTRPGAMTPVELCAVSVAPLITHQANEDFRLDALTVYYEYLGAI